MKKFFLTTEWKNGSFETCVDEVEMVRIMVYDGHVVFDLKTKNNIVFEEVPASRVYSTREEAQGALNELVNILKQ
jgi:hypothetical protein